MGMGFTGKYPGICRDNNDPFMVGRIRAEVAFPLGKGKECWSTWALPCLPPGHFEVPKEGDGVWVEFVGGDPNRPVWVGVWYAGRGTDSDEPTRAPFQAVHAALTDIDGANVETDNIETDAVADAEHKDGGHDHAAGQYYTPHRRVWLSETGHHLEFNDHPGADAYTRLFERYGRFVEMTARGILRLRSMVTPDWSLPDGSTADAAHSLVFADEWNPTGQYIELADMAGAKIRLQSTPGDEEIHITDVWGQTIKIRSKSGEQSIVLSDHNSNVITMANGKVTIAVAASSHVHVGGEAGQELATKAFVQTYYNAHTHMSAAPGSPTTPPLIPSPLTLGLDITKKQKSE